MMTGTTIEIGEMVQQIIVPTTTVKITGMSNAEIIDEVAVGIDLNRPIRTGEGKIHAI